jgi:hypothetical protein
VILTFRPIKVWPDGWQDAGRKRKPSPFSSASTYSKTLRLLDAELRHLGSTEVTLQVAASDRDLRLDGQLRADAKVEHPGVILTVETKRHGTLTYPCDTFERRWSHDPPSWQINLRAIALGLEALRKVERYGIAERGQQYAGYRELGTGIELGRAPMTVEQAARFIAENAGDSGWINDVEDDPFFALVLFKDAAKTLHPDVGGDEQLFKRLMEARDVLEAADSA